MLYVFFLSNKQEQESQTIKQEPYKNTLDNTENKLTKDNKYINKAVDNVQKYDISKNIKSFRTEPDPKELVKVRYKPGCRNIKTPGKKVILRH